MWTASFTCPASRSRARRAIRRLRDLGHRLRFVTNSTTRSRSSLAQELRAMGLELEDDELQTTAVAAGRALAGKRVLALTMAAMSRTSGIRPRRRGRGRRPARRRGRDRGGEPRLLVHEPGAGVLGAGGRRGALLPAQEPLVADLARAAARRGRFVAGLSTPPGSRRPSSASRAPPTSRPRWKPSTPTRRWRGWSGTTSRPTSRRAALRHADGPRPYRQVPPRRGRAFARPRRTSSSTRSPTSRTGWRSAVTGSAST